MAKKWLGNITGKQARQYWTNVVKNKLKPYQFDANKFSDTFLVNQPIITAQTELKEAPQIIWVFWTGDNEMSENRCHSMKVLQTQIGVPVQLITPHNLHEYILPNAPLHLAYENLSLVHKADYLRCYFMHFYGGGYHDVKACTTSWLPLFQKLNCSTAYILGYPEICKKHLALVGGVLQQELEKCFSQIIGNCAYICRPNTPFTQDWYTELLRRMDKYAPDLAKHPGNIWGNNEGYPIPWTNILGDIFHPLNLKYLPYIMRDKTMRPVLKDYR